jgi:hypothetical protein
MLILGQVFWNSIETLIGKANTKFLRCQYIYLVLSPFANCAIISELTSSNPFLLVTKARGILDPVSGSGTPTTQTSETAGCLEITSSKSVGET